MLFNLISFLKKLETVLLDLKISSPWMGVSLCLFLCNEFFHLRATLTPMHFSLYNFVTSSLRVVGSPCWILGYTIIFIFPHV